MARPLLMILRKSDLSKIEYRNNILAVILIRIILKQFVRARRIIDKTLRKKAIRTMQPLIFQLCRQLYGAARFSLVCV